MAVLVLVLAQRLHFYNQSFSTGSLLSHWRTDVVQRWMSLVHGHVVPTRRIDTLLLAGQLKAHYCRVPLDGIC